MDTRSDRHRPGTVPAPAGGSTADFDSLLRVLTRALRQLGEAGHPEEASRLAAQGWSAVRATRPGAAERLNGTMHYLARLPDPENTPHRSSPAPATNHPDRPARDRSPQGAPPCLKPTSSSTSAPSPRPGGTS